MADWRRNPNGKKYSFFKIVSVSSSTFGTAPDYIPDCVITFPTKNLRLEAPSTGTAIVEYSFEGYDVSGELVSGNDASRIIEMPGISVNRIWLRVKSGSTGPVNIKVFSYGWLIN